MAWMIGSLCDVWGAGLPWPHSVPHRVQKFIPNIHIPCYKYVYAPGACAEVRLSLHVMGM